MRRARVRSRRSREAWTGLGYIDTHMHGAGNRLTATLLAHHLKNGT